MASSSKRQVSGSGEQLQIIGSGSDNHGTYDVVVRPELESPLWGHVLRSVGGRTLRWDRQRGEETRVVFADELEKKEKAQPTEQGRRPNSFGIKLVPAFA